jgi:hypothetical protein
MIAERSPTTGAKFACKILTPKERETLWARKSMPVKQWWILQKERQALGAGYKKYYGSEWRSYPHGLNGGKVENLERVQGARCFDSETQTSEEPNAKNVEDVGAADVEMVGGGSTTDAVESAAGVDDTVETNATESESSNEPSIGAMKRISADITTAAVGGSDVSRPRAESVDAEAEAITDQHEEMEGPDSSFRALALLDEKLRHLYPDMWNTAQFLAGRQVLTHSRYSLSP